MDGDTNMKMKLNTEKQNKNKKNPKFVLKFTFEDIIEFDIHDIYFMKITLYISLRY